MPQFQFYMNHTLGASPCFHQDPSLDLRSDDLNCWDYQEFFGCLCARTSSCLTGTSLLFILTNHARHAVTDGASYFPCSQPHASHRARSTAVFADGDMSTPHGGQGSVGVIVAQDADPNGLTQHLRHHVPHTSPNMSQNWRPGSVLPSGVCDAASSPRSRVTCVSVVHASGELCQGWLTAALHHQHPEMGEHEPGKLDPKLMCSAWCHLPCSVGR